MEREDLDKINGKMVDIITLLAFIDSKLSVIIDRMPISVGYSIVVAQKDTHSITCPNEE